MFSAGGQERMDSPDSFDAIRYSILFSTDVWRIVGLNYSSDN